MAMRIRCASRSSDGFTVTIERRVVAGARGFTLVEVLVATLILSVGLLALESLGIAVSRSMTRAERESEWAFAAGRRAERTLDSLRSGCLGAHAPAVVELLGAATTADTLVREITEVAGLYTVRLSLRPAQAAGLVRPDTFTLLADAFVPAPYACSL